MVIANWAVRNKQFNCGAVLTVIKTYRYMIYVDIFVTVNCGSGRNRVYHQKPLIWFLKARSSQWTSGWGLICQQSLYVCNFSKNLTQNLFKILSYLNRSCQLLLLRRKITIVNLLFATSRTILSFTVFSREIISHFSFAF